MARFAPRHFCCGRKSDILRKPEKRSVTFGTAWPVKRGYRSGQCRLCRAGRSIMSVGRADANGAGSVSPPVPAPAPEDSAASGKGMPKAGLADGANTTWSTARKPVQVAEVSKRPASFDFKAIDVALDDLTFAELRFVGAYNSYVKEKSYENRAAYQ